MTGPERKIQKECEDKLRELGWFVFRAEFVGKRGFPDTTAIKRGHHLYIEFKKPGGKPSAQQIKISDRFHFAGTTFVFASSWEDVAPYA